MGCRRLCDEPNGHGPQFSLARQALIAEGAAEELAETFKALADPTRARIISALSAAEPCVGDLAALLGMTLSAVSHQLRLLRQLRVARPAGMGGASTASSTMSISPGSTVVGSTTFITIRAPRSGRWSQCASRGV